VLGATHLLRKPFRFDGRQGGDGLASRSPCHLSGLDQWVTNLSVRLYLDDAHWVMLEKHTQAAEIGIGRTEDLPPAEVLWGLTHRYGK
jgi:hypothetical protein